MRTIRARCDTQMPNYRRVYIPGGTFFFTVVTENRAPFLCDDRARAILRTSIENCRHKWPMTIDAIVLLPDHLHTIWTLPTDDSDYCRRWAWIKKEFTKAWLASHGKEQSRSDSRLRNRRRGVWQRRFWEHAIRNDDDLINHVEYIHYNPIKHGLVKCPHNWPYSSFHRYVAQGVYPQDWACACKSDKPHVANYDEIAKQAGE